MKRFFSVPLLLFGLFATLPAHANDFVPDPNSERELAVAKAILKAKEKDPGLQAWFDSAAGYVVLPKVGKAGMGIGGARGTGLLIKNHQAQGKVTMTQLSVGFQLGAQAYIELIFFKDDVAMKDFERGNFELGAQASAVAITAGASADAAYSKGVAIFTITEGGLMYEATVGGQKFKYEAGKS
jgi:lipid-binding SYLF domain-containing protein